MTYEFFLGKLVRYCSKHNIYIPYDVKLSHELILQKYAKFKIARKILHYEKVDMNELLDTSLVNLIEKLQILAKNWKYESYIQKLAQKYRYPIILGKFYCFFDEINGEMYNFRVTEPNPDEENLTITRISDFDLPTKACDINECNPIRIVVPCRVKKTIITSLQEYREYQSMKAERKISAPRRNLEEINKEWSILPEIIERNTRKVRFTTNN